MYSIVSGREKLYIYHDYNSTVLKYERSPDKDEKKEGTPFAPDALYNRRAVE